MSRVILKGFVDGGAEDCEKENSLPHKVLIVNLVYNIQFVLKIILNFGGKPNFHSFDGFPTDNYFCKFHFTDSWWPFCITQHIQAGLPGQDTIFF